MVVWVGGAGATGAGTTTGAAVVVGMGAGGAAVVVVRGALGVAVELVAPDVVRVAVGAPPLEDCVEDDALEPAVVVELDRRDAAAAFAAALLIAARVDAATDAAVALALCAVVVSAATMRRSLARVALRFASVRALRAAWRDT